MSRSCEFRVKREPRFNGQELIEHGCQGTQVPTLAISGLTDGGRAAWRSQLHGAGMPRGGKDPGDSPEQVGKQVQSNPDQASYGLTASDCSETGTRLARVGGESGERDGRAQLARWSRRGQRGREGPAEPTGQPTGQPARRPEAAETRHRQGGGRAGETTTKTKPRQRAGTGGERG